jgi:hypothetical protein
VFNITVAAGPRSWDFSRPPMDARAEDSSPYYRDSIAELHRPDTRCRAGPAVLARKRYFVPPGGARKGHKRRNNPLE